MHDNGCPVCTEGVIDLGGGWVITDILRITRMGYEVLFAVHIEQVAP
jgi:hypothetical protein